MRSRPDDYTGTVNSVNPSPKKQPRLNLQSPKDSHWSSNGHHGTVAVNAHENMFKRYKLEDQLSDIQYIDCSTPEHTANNPNTIYASAQIHNPPTSSRSSDLNAEGRGGRNDGVVRGVIDSMGGSIVKSRYSYPGMKVTDASDMHREDRFSYPGNGKKFVCRVPINNNGHIGGGIDNGSAASTVTKTIGRFSYCDPIGSGLGHTPVNLVLRSSSAEIIKRSDLGKSKLSIATPSSPVKSPRYSLLVGDTSSENSSSINTPLYDREMSASGATLQSAKFSVDQFAKENVHYGSDDNNCSNVS